MEAVGVWRATEAEDEYGNPVQGDLEFVETLQLLVAPQVQDEPKLLGRSPILTNYNIFSRDLPTGILPDDVLEVRGEKTPVDGRIAVWSNTDGTFNGEQIQVKLVSG